MSTPNITPAQVLALVAAVVGLFISQGAISSETGKQVVGIASIALPIVIALADAVIRHGRSQVAAEEVRAAAVPDPSSQRTAPRRSAATSQRGKGGK